ncbi:hypothetical protein [Nocardioides bruguierae]|uniref:Uncharacterized protein n=1 Tax=Nocardioides bruguierae TaxID=2945102 RepID=A0A9X2D951_9ACTN|nr:hypothetical protein [Nocardioides bruguierae]MCM0621645.1 hypothetical protein [Nocardioides bruguierae]
MAASNLEGLYRELQSQFTGHELMLSPVCTRVLLRTGVNLKALRPDQAADAALLGSVRAVLAEMGYAA